MGVCEGAVSEQHHLSNMVLVGLWNDFASVELRDEEARLGLVAPGRSLGWTSGD